MGKAGKHLSSFGGQVAGMATKVVGWGSAIAAIAGVGGIGYMVKQSMTAIDATAKLSDRLGIQTEKLIGLQHAAGLAGAGSEALATGLQRMQLLLAGTADDGENATNAFSKIGLNAAELSNLAPDEAFRRIADQLAGIENPAQRAAAAAAIFGKSAGPALSNLLAQGSAGIEAAQAEAERLGITFSRVDAAKVEAANDAMTRLKAVVTGVAQTLTIQLAPFITAATDKLIGMATSGEGMGARVVNAFEWVTKAVASAADYVGLLKVGFHGFRAGALEAIASIVDAFDWLGRKIIDVINLIPGVEIEATGTLSNLAESLHQVAGEEAAKFNQAMEDFRSGKHASAVASAFDDIRAKAEANAQAIADGAAKMNAGAMEAENMADALRQAEQNAQKVTSTIGDLQTQVAQFGLSDTQKKLMDLEAIGASSEEIAKAEGLLRELDRLKLDEKLADKAQQIADSVKTPIELYNEKLDELNELLLKGLLTQDQFDRAATAARRGIEGADVDQAPSILQSGSAAADRFKFTSARGIDAMDRQDIPKKQLKESETQTDVLERIERKIEAPPRFEVMDF